MADNRVVFETPWFDIEEIDSEAAGAGSAPYYRLNAEDGVMILALTKERHIICIRQFRPAVQEWTLELPSGGVSEGETIEAAARRELAEETGYRTGTISMLNAGRIMANRVNSMQYAVLATDCEPIPGAVPEDGISVELLSLEQLKALSLEGNFSHFTALASLVMAQWRGLDLEL